MAGAWALGHPLLCRRPRRYGLWLDPLRLGLGRPVLGSQRPIRCPMGHSGPRMPRTPLFLRPVAREDMGAGPKRKAPRSQGVAAPCEDLLNRRRRPASPRSSPKSISTLEDTQIPTRPQGESQYRAGYSDSGPAQQTAGRIRDRPHQTRGGYRGDTPLPVSRDAPSVPEGRHSASPPARS